MTLDKKRILNHEDFCYEMMFSVTPLKLFTIAAILHTARWMKIYRKLSTGVAVARSFDISIIATVTFKTVYIPVGMGMY